MKSKNATFTANDATVVSILMSDEAQTMKGETPVAGKKTVHNAVVRTLEKMSRKAADSSDGFRLNHVECQLMHSLLESSLQSNTLEYEATGEELVESVKSNSDEGKYGITQDEMDLYLRLHGLLAA